MSLVPSSTRQAPSREIVVDAQPIMDTARFDHMARVATMITNSWLVPESMAKEGNTWLPPEQVRSRVFVVVNQAVRWGMDPFAVLQACSMVRGKLCYEGKLVAAVLEARAGVSLDYEWNNEAGDRAGIKVTGNLPDGRVRSIEGTVGEWKTDGTNSPWKKPANHRRMLAYRGAREFVRIYMPAVLLGVYTEDEMSDMQEVAREVRRGRMQPPVPPSMTAPMGDTLIEHAAAEHREEQPADVDLKGNTDALAEEKPAEQQPAADQKAIKKTPPAAPSAKPAAKASEAPQDQTPVKKAPPIPPANKAKAVPVEEPKPEDTDQTDWEAEVEAFDNACSSAETAEEIEEEKQAHEHLFALTTPKAIGDRVDQIVAAELERIGRQG